METHHGVCHDRDLLLPQCVLVRKLMRAANGCEAESHWGDISSNKYSLRPHPSLRLRFRSSPSFLSFFYTVSSLLLTSIQNLISL